VNEKKENAGWIDSTKDEGVDERKKRMVSEWGREDGRKKEREDLWEEGLCRKENWDETFVHTALILLLPVGYTVVSQGLLQL
jgi:hypothetical protein